MSDIEEAMVLQSLEQEKMKVSQVAQMLSVSMQAIYKKLVTVGNSLATHLKKEKGVTYLTHEGVRILQESFGDKPQEKVSSVGNLVATLESQVREQKEFHRRADREEVALPPAEKMTWYHRLWVEMFEPERLRRFDS